MKITMGRWLIHAITGLTLAFLYALLFNVPWDVILPFSGISFLAALIPDMDGKLGIGHRHPVFHSFLIPMAINYLFPGTLFAKAFTIGYIGHMIEDLEGAAGFVKIGSILGKALLLVSATILLYFIII